MAAVNTYNPASSEGSQEKVYPDDVVNINGADNNDDADSMHHHLHRGLKARQITMIAIGGAIGTGLIIGT